MITDKSKLSAFSRQLSATRAGVTLTADGQQTFKDREDETSQLNRLGVAYFHLVYFRFQPRITSALLSFKSVGATVVSVFLSRRPISGG
jgi:hypothetical protein